MNKKRVNFDLGRLYGMPLPVHFDDGFGITAEDYFWSACSLFTSGVAREASRLEKLALAAAGAFKIQRFNSTIAKDPTGKTFQPQGLHDQLNDMRETPAAFLCRHAVELYLKSFILILHRHHALNFDQELPNTPLPKLKVTGRWKPLFREHRIQNLFDYFIELYETHLLSMSFKARKDWELDKELGVWIQTIDSLDERSDYFRYPLSSNPDRDVEKRGDKEVSTDWKKHLKTGKYLRTFNGRYWICDNKSLKREKEHLYSAAFEFFVLHNLLRQECCDGR